MVVDVDYNFSTDLKTIRELQSLTQSEFASKIGVEQVTISRSELEKTKPSKILIEKVYEFAFKNNIHLGKLKEMFWKEDINRDHKLLYHGSKSGIIGKIDVTRGRANNDFGQGFYTGENYVQALSFVSSFADSCLYFIDFDAQDLACKKYQVDQEWMLTIAYYRGTLDQYKNHKEIVKLIESSRNCDYNIAPIADNRMFQIINSFIDGEITDEQCKHCLAATNLGYQYVLKSKKAINQLKIVEKSYICASEKTYYQNVRTNEAKLGDDKVKMARIKYRGKGKYIDEIFK